MVLMDRENEHIRNDFNRNLHHIHMDLDSEHIGNEVNLGLHNIHRDLEDEHIGNNFSRNLHNVHRDLENKSKILSPGKDTLEEQHAIDCVCRAVNKSKMQSPDKDTLGEQIREPHREGNDKKTNIAGPRR